MTNGFEVFERCPSWSYVILASCVEPWRQRVVTFALSPHRKDLLRGRRRLLVSAVCQRRVLCGSGWWLQLYLSSWWVENEQRVAPRSFYPRCDALDDLVWPPSNLTASELNKMHKAWHSNISSSIHNRVYIIFLLIHAQILFYSILKNI